MPNNLKHVGQLINTQRRCVVVFREVPDEPENCLIVDTDALPDWIHDDVINAVESPAAQASANFYEYANRALLTDGSNMLTSLHKRGLLRKHSTSNVMMTPNRSASIRLDELNAIIREQSGDKPAVKKPEDELDMAAKTQPARQAQPAQDQVIDDTDIARNMLTQAEQFENEAKNLREQAYEMAPSLKPKRARKTSPKKQEA